MGAYFPKTTTMNEVIHIFGVYDEKMVPSSGYMDNRYPPMGRYKAPTVTIPQLQQQSQRPFCLTKHYPTKTATIPKTILACYTHQPTVIATILEIILPY